MYDVYPIAHTQVDWNIFIRAVQDTLGVSPTRGLDELGILSSVPAAYLASLDCGNNPLEALRRARYASMVHASFLTLVPRLSTILPFYDYAKIAVIETPRDQQYLVILDASLKDWIYCTTKLCQVDSLFAVRAIAGRIMNHLESMGYKECWSQYEKIEQSDKTICLRHL